MHATILVRADRVRERACVMAMLGRVRARAALMDPGWKRLIRETQHRNRGVERRLVRAIDDADGRVLGVGSFSRPVARALMAVEADVVDARPWNPEANLFADLADGEEVLWGRYELIVSQDGLCGTANSPAVVESISSHLSPDGRMILVFQTRATPHVGHTGLRRSLRQVAWDRGTRLVLVDRGGA